MSPVPKINLLPADIKDALNQKLVDNGFGDYVVLSAWLSDNGYEISKTALGKYGLGIKTEMEKSLSRARERMAIAKALRGATDDEKAALLEANEMVVLDEVMTLFEQMREMDVATRIKHLPKLINASANVGRGAVGTAKWKKEFEAEVRKQAAEQAVSTAKAAGVSEETIARIHADVLGMSG